MWRELGYIVYFVDIGKGIGLRGLWRREERERRERRKGEAIVNSSEEGLREKEREWKEGTRSACLGRNGAEIGSWWSLSLKGTGYSGDKNGQQNDNISIFFL